MSLTDLLFSQLADPFRIGLIIALFITMLRTEAASGRAIPLAAGAVFVAVIIPVTLQTTQVLPMWQVVAVGVVANAILIAVVLAAWEIYKRFKG